jgi:hypothetical protein
MIIAIVNNNVPLPGLIELSAAMFPVAKKFYQLQV